MIEINSAMLKPSTRSQIPQLKNILTQTPANIYSREVRVKAIITETAGILLTLNINKRNSDRANFYNETFGFCDGIIAFCIYQLRYTNK